MFKLNSPNRDSPNFLGSFEAAILDRAKLPPAFFCQWGNTTNFFEIHYISYWLCWVFSRKHRGCRDDGLTLDVAKLARLKTFVSTNLAN